MNKLFYVEDVDRPGTPLLENEDDPKPWWTHDVLEARFFVYSLNLFYPGNTFQVKEFAPTAYLEVPYKSQWGVGANVRHGDCGPACIAMIVPFLTKYNPTVDQAAASCGQPATGPAASYTNHAQLRQGAAAYDVTLVTRSPKRKPQLDMELLEESLEAGLPSIALIHYGVLRDETNKLPVALGYIRNQDQTYDRGHWVVVIGMDDRDVYIHDPDYYGTREQDGNARAVPRFAFFEALKTVAPGCSVGFQGLIVSSPENQLEG